MSETIDCIIIAPGNTLAVYQGLAAEFSAIEPPSLAAMFATYLRAKGMSVAIIDAPAMGYSPEQVATIIADDFDPVLIVLAVYGFQPSASTQNMPAAGATARAIRELCPTAKILMTGTHPAAIPERTLREESAVDYVCNREGPQTISALIHALKTRIVTNVPDLFYRRGRAILRTPPGMLLADLDRDIPGAAWDLLPMNRYRAHNWHRFDDLDQRRPYASIHTSLGCPYACSFCSINAPFGKSSYRMWSPATVGAELEHLVRDRGIRNIKIADEMFILNRAHVLGICDEIDRRGLGDHLDIWCYGRVDSIQDEFLDRMRASGFRWVALGIESASKHIRDGVAKGRFDSEEIIKTVRKIQASGINVIGNYIFGLPDDTHESMQATLDLALEVNCEMANFYSCMAFPGSNLFRMAKEKDLPTRWSGYSQHSFDCRPLPTATLTSAEVLAFRDQSFQTYFNAPSYLDHVRRKFGQAAVNHIGRMLAQPLARQLTASLLPAKP